MYVSRPVTWDGGNENGKQGQERNGDICEEGPRQGQRRRDTGSLIRPGTVMAQLVRSPELK